MTNPSLFTGIIQATDDQSGLPVLILGITGIGEILAVNDEGKFVVLLMEKVTLDWRYNWKDHTWVDVNEVFDEKDDAPDGGESVQGSVSQLDLFGQSDPLDPEGRQATGDPGDLDSGENQ